MQIFNNKNLARTLIAAGIALTAMSAHAAPAGANIKHWDHEAAYPSATTTERQDFFYMQDVWDNRQLVERDPTCARWLFKKIEKDAAGNVIGAKMDCIFFDTQLSKVARESKELSDKTGVPYAQTAIRMQREFNEKNKAEVAAENKRRADAKARQQVATTSK